MASSNGSLDAADRRLLRTVQEDCLMPADQVGERCGMSASTVLRRLKRLRKLGVIRAEAAVVDPRKVGKPLQFIIGVRLEGEDAQIARAFLDRVRFNPLVTQCYFVTGSADYVLHVCARDMEEYNGFVQDLVSDPHVAMSETHVVIDPVKVSLAVPIDA